MITTNGERKLLWIRKGESDMVSFFSQFCYQIWTSFKVKSMKGTWDLDAFGLIEAKSIIEAVSCKTGPGELNM